MKKAHNRIDMAGKKYNNWQVVDYSHTKGKITYWKCRCELCKQEYIVDGRNVRSGRSKQCVKCGQELTRQSNIGKEVSKETRDKISKANTGKKCSEETKNKLRGFKLSLCDKVLANIDPTQNPGGHGLRISARINNIRQSAKVRKKIMTLTKLEIALLITKSCFYCNSEPEPYNGIDRIDSSRGYEPDNVVACCYRCNCAKNNMSTENFKEWIKKVHSNLNNF